ncbi:MAG: transporter substrate-binding domain-containing protein, partial [Candidatus Cloacimonadaceae bacterium]|nr:transporter substrate-binding domain-containing protein [Candidatus Cloacimonadaceae bacterium]
MAYEAMFRLRIAVFGMLLLLCLNANVLAARSVRVGIYDNAPKIFINEEQEPDGIFIDVLNEIARREAWDLEYLHGNWDECLERLASGEIDLMPDVAFTAGRAEIFSFHDNQVFSSWSQVFARQGSNIKSILDLDKKRVSVLKGSVHIEKFLSLVNGFGLDIELVEQADFDMVMEAISRGKADAAIVNSLFGMVHARHYLLEDTAIVFNPSTLFFATAKGQNTDLLIAIDKHMTAMKQNPSSAYYQSLKRWTGEEVKYRLPHWVLILLSLIIGILAFSVIIGFILKRQVRLKTAELRESNFEMEKNIILRTSELAAAMEKAQVADNLKSAFLATMSHELRTPLNSIIGFTGIMLQEMPGPLNDEQKKQLNMVKSSARHLLSLINDVLDISKIEAGQLELFYESFDLRTSLVEMIRLVIPLAEKKGIEL